jgi:D-glycero-D-manno-heptose 1,7-bisphosphate phosphatase
MRPAVFLDRDNTLIRNDGDLGDPEGVVLMQGAASAIASLRGLGYQIVVVTNQGGVARGRYTEEDVHAVHDRIAERMIQQANGATIDAFYYCPYHPEGTVEKYKREHPSRKPSPGMLLQAAADLKLDLSTSWMIGDALRDIAAGRAAGTRTILLRDGSAGPLEGVAEGDRPDYVAAGMVAAVRIIAQQRSPELADEAKRPRKPGEPKRREWDAKRVAEIQKPREPQDGGERPPPKAGREGGAEFRPWSVGKPAPEKPIAVTPFRKRFLHEDEDDAPASAAPAPAAPPRTPPAQPPAPAETRSAPVADPPVPAEPAAAPSVAPESAPAAPAEPKPAPSEADKTLRLILKELRSQRGSSGEFGYLTIIAVVLELIAIICLLGALWRGGSELAVFARWMGVALIAQLGVIAALMFER